MAFLQIQDERIGRVEKTEESNTEENFVCNKEAQILSCRF